MAGHLPSLLTRTWLLSAGTILSLRVYHADPRQIRETPPATAALSPPTVLCVFRPLNVTNSQYRMMLLIV